MTHSTSSGFHKSVLLSEVLDFLQVKNGQKYIDATLGGGGHSSEIIKRGGLVLGMDVDQDAIKYASKNFKLQIANGKLKLAKGNFRDIAKIAHLHLFDRVSGLIFDLGVSSHQLENAQRGFSFQKEGPLDMRMDPGSSSGQVKASDIVNLASKNELYEIFTKLGQERSAKAVSRALVRARRIKAILTTEDLARVVEGSFGFKKKPPLKVRARILKRVFQALRIAVNSELENLDLGLRGALSILESGGRILVISFHSLEDRIVKEAFQNFGSADLGKVITKKPITPSLAELKENRRARSAKLRVFEKL